MPNPTNGHTPVPVIDPGLPLPDRLNLQGYQALLTDYCQTVDQLAALTAFAIATWESLQQVRNLLDLPRQPLPLSASRALATKPVLPPMSGPAVAGATKES